MSQVALPDGQALLPVFLPMALRLHVAFKPLAEIMTYIHRTRLNAQTQIAPFTKRAFSSFLPSISPHQSLSKEEIRTSLLTSTSLFSGWRNVLTWPDSGKHETAILTENNTHETLFGKVLPDSSEKQRSIAEQFCNTGEFAHVIPPLSAHQIRLAERSIWQEAFNTSVAYLFLGEPHITSRVHIAETTREDQGAKHPAYYLITKAIDGYRSFKSYGYDDKGRFDESLIRTRFSLNAETGQLLFEIEPGLRIPIIGRLKTLLFLHLCGEADTNLQNLGFIVRGEGINRACVVCSIDHEGLFQNLPRDKTAFIERVHEGGWEHIFPSLNMQKFNLKHRKRIIEESVTSFAEAIEKQRDTLRALQEVCLDPFQNEMHKRNAEESFSLIHATKQSLTARKSYPSFAESVSPPNEPKKGFVR